MSKLFNYAQFTHTHIHTHTDTKDISFNIGSGGRKPPQSNVCGYNWL